MWVLDLLSSPQLPCETECCSCRSTEAATVSVGKITSGDFFEGDRGVAIIHDRLREVGGALAVWSGEVADDVARFVRSFPHMGTRGGGLNVKLPTGSVFVQEMRDAAPVYKVSFIAAGSFLTDVIGRDDAAEIRNRER